MIPKKIPARGEAQPGFQTTFRNLHCSACPHPQVALVRLNCGAGGTQFRKFCLTCWSPIGTAIPHAAARDEQMRSGIQAPLADLGTIHAAQNCFERRARNGVTT